MEKAKIITKYILEKRKSQKRKKVQFQISLHINKGLVDLFYNYIYSSNVYVKCLLKKNKMIEAEKLLTIQLIW